MNTILSMLIALTLSFNNKEVDRTQYGIWSECVKQEVLYPDIAVRISTTETQNGTTGVGKSRNNIFGFRNKSGYIYFKDITACISYYKKWQDRRYPKHLEVAHKSSNCDYYCFIESVGWKTGKPYSAAERKYTNYLKRIKLNLNNE
jgi:hypothetical protein